LKEIDYIISDIKRIQNEPNNSKYDDRRKKKILGERSLLHSIYLTLYGLGLDGDWGNPNSFYIEDHTGSNGVYDFRIYIINSYGSLIVLNPLDSKNWADYSNKDERVVKKFMVGMKSRGVYETPAGTILLL